MKYTIKVDIKAGSSSSSFKEDCSPELISALDKIIKEHGDKPCRAEAFLKVGLASVAEMEPLLNK